MPIKILFVASLALLLALFGGALTVAQDKSILLDCRKYPVQDSDKRDFNDRDVFTLDVDGDGAPDIVMSRIYTVKTKRSATAGKTKSLRETHWMLFDLKTAKGCVIESFFKYEYGTDVADCNIEINEFFIGKPCFKRGFSVFNKL